MATILATFDGSAISQQILPLIQKLGGEFKNLDLRLLTVAPEPQATARETRAPDEPRFDPVEDYTTGLRAAPPTYEETEDQAIDRVVDRTKHRLEDMAAALREQGIATEIEVRIGPPAEEIIQAAREHSVDFILMSTHGRSGLSRLVHGSVTEAVVRSGVAPVILMRPSA